MCKYFINKLLFFDVDTQHDFIYPDGALYVQDAETLVDNFKVIINFARENNIPIWGSVDAHLPGDAELKGNQGTFPDHCMLGEQGQQKILTTRPVNPLWVENRPHQQDEIEKILQHKGEIYFQKQSFDVFDNPAIKFCITKFNRVVVFGVATDYCVLSAVLGFLKNGLEVFLVTDAIKAVNMNKNDGQKALKRMSKAGAKSVSVHGLSNTKIFN